MTRLRSPAGWLMSAKERKVFTDVVVILIRIEKRSKRARKASRELKQEKARDMICLYIKGRGPCFLRLFIRAVLNFHFSLELHRLPKKHIYQAIGHQVSNTYGNP